MPDLFLSYSRDDSLVKDVVVNNLRRLGFNVWIYAENLLPGAPDFSQVIDKAIAKVDALVVICTPRALQSPWVNGEIMTALSLNKPIFPILTDGDLISSIPLNLRGGQYADMRGRADYEAEFRKLVNGIASKFDLSVAKFSMDLSGHPTVTVNVYGSVQGNIVAVGNNQGEVNVAGRDINQHGQLDSASANVQPNPSNAIPQSPKQMAGPPAPHNSQQQFTSQPVLGNNPVVDTSTLPVIPRAAQALVLVLSGLTGSSLTVAGNTIGLLFIGAIILGLCVDYGYHKRWFGAVIMGIAGISWISVGISHDTGVAILNLIWMVFCVIWILYRRY